MNTSPSIRPQGRPDRRPPRYTGAYRQAPRRATRWPPDRLQARLNSPESLINAPVLRSGSAPEAIFPTSCWKKRGYERRAAVAIAESWPSWAATASFDSRPNQAAPNHIRQSLRGSQMCNSAPVSRARGGTPAPLDALECAGQAGTAPSTSRAARSPIPAPAKAEFTPARADERISPLKSGEDRPRALR